MKLEDVTSKPVFKVTDFLTNRGWQSKEAFMFSLCLYLIACIYVAFFVTNIAFLAITQGMTLFQSFIMSCILTIPFLIGIIGTTIGTYKLQGKI